MGVALEIHACDLNPDLSAACALADASFAAPRCTDDGYIPLLRKYTRENGIGLIVPTIDTELQPLADARPDFSAQGTYVHVSSPQVIDIVRDKKRTMDVLAEAGVPVPRTARLEDFRRDPAGWDWPLFVKPVSGSASRGVELVQDIKALDREFDEPMLVQELLRGDEYTINLFVDEDGVMQAAIPHLRISIRAGEVEKGRTVRRDDFEAIARNLAAAMPGARGVLCFQVFDDPVLGPRVIEINARFGGGYPLADQAGGHFAENVLRQAMGEPLVNCADWRDGVTMLRYDNAVFV
ncbi:ATP-grasp domain-containing protein [Erythrobacter sp. GH3-10]|uniref:ATP-grasp domain-containing protein n=2 Tax=Aurantiacibacter rhizosphaerae TaxID=2691582 RepID=A0A844XCM9_9SPHN|nr:ATP-grasp domain-containing protein [Aurantiacibacter rhizosphaerae]